MIVSKNKMPVNVYVVMEDMEYIEDMKKKPEITNMVDTPNLFYVEFYAVLQDFLRVNRNKRFYPGRLMVPAFKAPHILELLANQSFACEAGHPDTEDMRRCLTIDPKNVCATILSMDTDERYNKGTIRTIDDGDGGVGRKLARLILQGTNAAWSLRALSKLKTRPDGTSEITSVPHVVCYDWVYVPSHNEAYLDRTKPVKTFAVNPFTGKQTVASFVKPVTESNISAIEEFIKEDSNHVKIATNALNICKEGLIVTDDYKFAVIKESGNTYHIPIEDYIRHDIMNYMSAL